ncbi:PaaI family thioesterase [Piscinibacter terrae]|uniref:Medium/long-chain acyl-CoA thioesterase YigI n=1 Tax=Piscinibacter terrae TaxID=2496871 RepID=A0A3N7HNM2_9BURK|nr:PaaI family thioesterase [Albitalea terrae]RQP23710.1 PaaI family thioesterase [Albitalea terrae]
MKFQVHIPFVEALGFELLRFENGEAEIAMQPREEHMNSWSVVHGGVSMTLLDVAMAHAARSPRDGGTPDPRGVVTIEMKTSFMKPGLGRLLAKARVLHQTSSFAFCEGGIHAEDGTLIAHATGTFKYLKALPAGGRQLKRLNASD